MIKPLIDIPVTRPPVNPLDIPKKVAIGQLLEIDSAGNFAGQKLRVTEDGAFEAMVATYTDHDPIVYATAECRMCHWTAELIGDDLSAIEYRAWHHEQANPGHLVSYRAEVE